MQLLIAGKKEQPLPDGISGQLDFLSGKHQHHVSDGSWWS